MRWMMLLVLCSCANETPEDPSELLHLHGHQGDAADAIKAHVATSLAAHSPEYDATLATMKGHGAEAAQILHDQYRELEHADYFRRFAVVHTCGKLDHTASLELFRLVLTTPTPPEEMTDTHHGSTVMEDELVKLAALEATAALAHAGNAEARALLEEATHHAGISIPKHAARLLVQP
jgi:hypothetical protein